MMKLEEEIRMFLILSIVVYHDKFKSFKALGVRNFYFKEEDNNILISKVGIRFQKLIHIL